MMDQDINQKNATILANAWERYSQYDAFAVKRNHAQLRLRRWVAIIGVAATFFAILVQVHPFQSNEIISWIFKFLLIISPILGSTLTAFGNKFFGNGDWLTLRAGAEEILKEIYNFRTILKNHADRRTYLEARLQEIQRGVYRGLGGEMAMPPFNGKLPPYFDSKDPISDPGFKDLNGEEYFKYRIQHQLGYHTNKVNQYQQERIRLQWLILLAGAAGAVLAAIGGTFSLWVALTATTTTALIGWQELRNLDSTVRNYSRVILELTIISNHWNNLEPSERTNREFYQMVRSTENILWSQNMEYIKSMQEALTAAKGEEEDLVKQVMKQSIDQDTEDKGTSNEAPESGTESGGKKSKDSKRKPAGKSAK